jgi:membrane-bound metal-dependent hydrolase YbcI (DUF457 family)
MYAVGHLAVGYLTGRAAGKYLKVNLNISLLFLVSVMPDIDLLIPVLEHRGPTHSLITFLLLLIPAILLYGKRAIPYFIALAQHSLIGDYITGSTQLLWPLTPHTYGTGMRITSLPNILLEWGFFLVSMALMLKMKDIRLLFQHYPSNLLLTTPLFAVLLPTVLNFPIHVPLELLIPHLTYLTLFTLSIIMDLKAILSK